MSRSYPARRLALGCSALALAAALAAPAQAQSFQGSANVVFGSATVVNGSGTTDVNIGSASAVIDWTPTDTAISAGTPINWQGAGTTATFTGTAGNFAVLNRIVPTDTSRPITFNGTVVSQFFQGQAAVRGGTMFFYSPGGIVLSPTAVFDVGNLGLTSSPPVVDGNGGWYTNNTVQFGQSGPSGTVRIRSGARITASPQGSYVAAFAPYIQQDGIVSSNGQVALVAAEAGSITFSPDGLFDIQVTTGTNGIGGESLASLGTTTGGASSGVGDNRRIYLISVAKNSAVTMTIQRGASLGFDIAGAANVQGNAVVLSAGYNVTGGVTETARAGGGGTGSISINDGGSGAGNGIAFTSAVNANASADIFASIFRQTSFASDAYLRADARSFVSVGAIANTPAGSLAVGGNLTISANRLGTASAADDAGQAQLVLVQGATTNVSGTAIVEADAFRDANADGVITGGLPQIRIGDASTLTVGSDLVLSAGGFSDGATGAPDAQGSTNVQLIVNGGSTVNVGRVTRVASYGIAGLNNGNGGQGADGRGGFSGLTVSGGANFTTRELNVAADGVGGADVGAGGGVGTGGSALINVSGANSVLTVQSPNVTGNINFGERDFLSGEGFGGRTGMSGGTGGSAQGGSAALFVSAGGRINLPIGNGTNLLRFIGRARGGDVAAGVNGTGGAATGGTVSIALDNATLLGDRLLASSFAQAGGAVDPATGALVNGASAVGGVRAVSLINGAVFTGSVTGGPGAQGGIGSSIGRGGDGTGGLATLLVDNSTLNVTAGGFGVFSQNSSGEGAIFGDVSGGVAQIDVINGATVNLATGARFGATSNNSTFASAAIPQAQSGGNVTAGRATLTVTNATIAGQGSLEVAASAFVGHTALAGGVGRAGNASLNITNATVAVADVTIEAHGNGGDYLPGTNALSGAAGGAGIGGEAYLDLSGATLSTNSVLLSAQGEGGDVDAAGTTGLTGGSGTGGEVLLLARSGVNRIDAGNLRINGSGIGADIGGGTGTGGNGNGGRARIDTIGGASLTINAPVTITSEGEGGLVGASGTGGTATGGLAYTYAIGAALTINGELFLDAVASAGDGDTGSSANGGRAYIQSGTGGSTTINGNVFANADAQGGSANLGPAPGGAATAGSAQLFASDGNARLTVNGDADLSARAFGGIGERDAAGNGGDGGIATGGLAEVGGFNGAGNVFEITGTVTLNAGADGGFAQAGSGGDATAGRAFVSAGNGTNITIGGDVFASADASGGIVDTHNGILALAGTRGGNATGGQALLQTYGSGGSVAVGGNAFLESNAYGGEVFNAVGDGGDATAGFAQIFARNGQVSILGMTDLTTTTQGGNGDTGGDAIALVNEFSETLISAVNATITLGAQTVLIASAEGGGGRDGGAGGSALSGTAIIDANSNTGAPSTIRLGEVFAGSIASGGTGGDGVGVAGGAGGSAIASAVQLFGVAGNGTLVISGTSEFYSVASGGAGGASDTATGGAGGAATGGYVQFGTRSGPDVGAVNAGSATFSDLQVFSDAVGGAGGPSVSGTGGAGGDAISLGGVLLVRGSPVTATSVSLGGFALGGDGGAGTTQGVGGFGVAGSVFVTATQRFERTERGSANIGTLNLFAFGQGGAGSTPGASYYAGEGGVSLIQSDVTVGTLSYSNSGSLPPPATITGPVEPIKLTLSDATLDVDSLAMTTPGEFLLNLDNSSMIANSFAISAGTFVLPATPPAAPGTITVRDSLSLAATAPGGSVRTFANFVANNAASFSSVDSIVLGNIDTDGLFEAESLTGTITVGDIDAGSASLTAQGNIQVGNVRVGGQFAADSGAGSLTLGTVDAATVALASATEISAGRITASSVSAEAGGTLNVLGAWSAPSIEITASDLAIPDGGALSAGSNGSIQLLTSNSAGAFIGDGLSGQSGFRIGNAEFARISGNDIFIGVLDNSANAVDLTFGTLTIGANELRGDSYLEFATGTASGQQSGRIRVDGAVTGSGYTAAQEIAFTTGSFELNTESGSIALSGNGPGGLGGIVTVDAANIHIASPAILTKLRADPRYAGVAEEINAPATIQRPDGVLRALGLQFFPSDTLYIQNTGAATNPAGFYGTLEESEVEPPGFEDSQAPDVDVIINGRFATAAGDVTGSDVFSVIVDDEETSLDGFSANSQVNGCTLSAESCGSGFEESPELAVLQSEFELLSGPSIEEEPFDLDESSEEEEEEAEEAARSPIEPPVILIDTRPLHPPLDITDPVSGSGNPASLASDPVTSGAGDSQ